MKFTKTALTLLFSAVLFCGCAKDSDVVLRINDEDITRKEFYDDFNKIKDSQFAQLPKEMQRDNSYNVLLLKDRYTNDVIIRKLLSQEFTKRKIEATDDEIKAKKDQIIAQISEEQFKKILKEHDISEERLNSDMASEVKVEKLADQLGAKKVTEADAQNFYKQNKAQFTVPERVQASHILINTNPDDIKREIVEADKEAKLSSVDIDKKVKDEVARREQLAAELQKKAAANPKNFEKLAKENSYDKASAEKGGDLGFVTKDSVVPEFGEAAFKQKVGVVGPLVKTQFGYHIILVKDKAAETTQPFKNVKADLMTYLERQNKIEQMQKLIEGLKSGSKIEYVDESLKPENLKKQIQDALKKQQEAAQKQGAPKSKVKALDKIKEDKKEQEKE